MRCEVGPYSSRAIYGPEANHCVIRLSLQREELKANSGEDEVAAVTAERFSLSKPSNAASVTQPLRIPRRWKVIQNVREKFSCREGEKMTRPSSTDWRNLCGSEHKICDADCADDDAEGISDTS